MRTLARPIEVIAHSDMQGKMSPLKFRAKTKENEDMVILIDKIESQERERISGNAMLLYKCRGIVNDKEREFELKFDIKSCKWMLWKMQ